MLRNQLFILFVISLSISAMASAANESDKKEPRDSKRKAVPVIETESSDDAKTSSVILRQFSPNGKELLAFRALIPTSHSSSPMAGEQINWQVFSGGATHALSDNYALLGTIGQTAVGLVTSDLYNVNQGYWQNFLATPSGCCIGTMGSMLLNNEATVFCTLLDDQFVDVADLTNLIDHLFINFTPLCCTDEGDIAPLMYLVDPQDGAIDVADLTGLIDHLFINFPALPACP